MGASMEKDAATEHAVHDLIRRRWSPRAFAPQPVADADLRSLLEAARWAPSCYNAQPWRFIVARHGDDAFEAIASTLNAFNQMWAVRAPLLVVSTAIMAFERNGEVNRHALHDVGQATAQLALQATALGLSAHQMAGYSIERLRGALSLPSGVEPVAVMAVGHVGDPADLPEGLAQLEAATRHRIPQAELVFDGIWGRPFLEPAR